MGKTEFLRASLDRRVSWIGLYTLLVVGSLTVGCSKSSPPTEEAKKTTADSATGNNAGPAQPAQPSIYSRGDAAPAIAPAAAAADNAWAERCKRSALINQAAELATQAKALQEKEDYAAAADKLNQYVEVQIQMNGEKSDYVKSAKSRVAENQWRASLSPANRAVLKQAVQIEADAESESTKGHFDVALTKGIDAIRIYQQLGGQDTAEYGRLALFIADKYVLIGDFKNAAGAYQRGLAITEQTEGLVSPVYGNSLLAMSGMWMNLGDYAEAVKTLQRACEVFKMLGEEDASAAYCLMMVGVIYKEVGDLGRAETSLKLALERAETLGADGRSIEGECLQHLAGVYFRAQNYSAAETAQLKAMQVLQETLGESPMLIGCRSRLARIYAKTGHLADAESMLKNAIKSGKEAFGDKSPVPSYAVQYLGELYVAQQNYAAAEPLLAEALAIREKGHGPNHPAVGEILEPYSVALRGLGRTAEAQQLEARKKTIDANAVAMREKLADISAKMIAERPVQRK